MCVCTLWCFGIQYTVEMLIILRTAERGKFKLTGSSWLKRFCSWECFQVTCCFCNIQLRLSLFAYYIEQLLVSLWIYYSTCIVRATYFSSYCSWFYSLILALHAGLPTWSSCRLVVLGRIQTRSLFCCRYELFQLLERNVAGSPSNSIDLRSHVVLENYCKIYSHQLFFF